MAGVPAGRLSIEIVAEIARLQQDLDKAKRAVNAASGDIARSARAANDNLASIGKGAGAGVQQFSREVARLKGQIDPAWASLQRYKEQVHLLRQALAQGAISHKQFVEEMRSAVATYQQGGQAIVRSSGAQRAGMQQLTMQLGDMSTMFALGARPMQIFASQSGQVVQSIQLMSGGVGRFASFLAGPWGLALTGAALVLAPLVGMLFESEEAATKSEKAQRSLTDVLSDTAASYDEVRDALAEYNKEQEKSREVTVLALGAQAAKIASNLKEAISIREKTKATLAEFDAMSRNPTILLDENMGPALASARSGFASQIAEQDSQIAGLTQAALNAAVQVAGAIAEIESDTTAKIKFQYEVRRKAARDSITDYDALRAKLIELNDAERLALDAAKDAERAGRKRKTALTEEQKALRDRNKETMSFIESLQEEIDKIGLDAQALRQLEIAKAKETAVTQAQRDAIDDLNQMREDALRIEEQLKAVNDAKKGTDKLQEEIAALQREAEVLGLSGWERQRRLTILEAEAEIRPLLVKIADAELKGEMALAEEYRKQIALINERTDAKLTNGDEAKRLDEAAEAARQLNDQFRDMAGLLDRLGGMGSILGSILAIASGNFNSVAGGPLGDILAYVLNQDTGRKTADGIAIKIGDELKDVFGSNGIFGQTLAQTLANAGLGYAAANAVFGPQNTAQSIGSSLGGIAGGIAGAAFQGTITAAATSAFGSTIGAALGSAVPVIGTLLGGLAGSLLGGLFGGAKKGVVRIGGSGSALDVFQTTLNDPERVKAATAAADSIIGSIQGLAEAFGGSIDASKASVTIGMKDGKWRVDTTGKGGTDTKKFGVFDFGEDQAAAVKAVMMDLIKDGVIDGIRASTMRLLQSGGDLEAALQKALAFESVFKELETAGNPFLGQLKALEAQFAQLTTIFQQAGATAAEYAELQQLLAMKQQQLIDQASASFRSTFYTDAENVAFARKTISATLTPLGLGNIRTPAQFKALVEATDAIANPELFGALMELVDEFGVLKEAAEQAAAAAAAEAAAKKAQREQEIEAARGDLLQAYRRERGELEQTVERYNAFTDSLKAFREELFAGQSGADSYAARLAKLRQVGSLAALGDEGALGSLPGVGRAFLDSARNQASSLQDYLRDVARVARFTDSAINASGGMVSEAEKQIAKLDEQVGLLVDINEGVLSVADAIDRLVALNPPPLNGTQNATQQAAKERDERLSERLDRLIAIGEQNNRTSLQIERLWNRLSPDGTRLLIGTDSDSPILTQAAS